MALSDEIAALNTSMGAVGTATANKNHAIETSVTTETTRAEGAESSEATARANADTAETTRAEAAEATLSGKVGTITTSSAAPSGGVNGDTWYQV